MTRRTPPLVPRMRANANSIFGSTSSQAARLGAVNLGQGFPGFDGPDEVRDAAIRAIAEGRGNQYPPMHGLPGLRQAVAAHQQRFYGLEVDWETEVCITTGGSEALTASILALADADDEVVIFEPWFDIYDAGIALAGARRISVPMPPPAFRPDIDALRDAITDRTRLLIVNSPHNPTGIVYTREELDAIARIAIEHDLVVISDEVYEHIVFDGVPHTPLASLPGMRERTVTIGSGGKTFSFTGWKVGWATGPADLIAAVRSVRQHLSYVSGGPFQWAIAEGLALPDDYFTGLASTMQAGRDRLTEGLGRLDLGIVPSAGTYFLTTDVRPAGFESGAAFCSAMLERARVVALPHSGFCRTPAGEFEPYVRWAFCKPMPQLDEALERLAGVLR